MLQYWSIHILNIFKQLPISNILIQIKSPIIIINPMNRPYSAKNRQQGYWGHQPTEERQSDIKPRLRKNVKLMKPDLTTNDFSRILPRKMYKDKERLYSEGLQLKQAYNDVTQENVRLKTQISMMQKEQQKASRLNQSHDGKTNNHKSLMKTNKIDRSVRMVQDLKKIFRDCREENIELQAQNSKIKKSIKYIKINELQIELKIVIEENKKLAKLVEEYGSQLNLDQKLEVENNELRQALQKEYKNNKELQDQVQNSIQQQEEIQARFKEQTQKWKIKQNKYLREVNLQRRKQIENQKHIEDLRRELKSLLQNKSSQTHKKPTRPLNRPGHQKMLTEVSVQRMDLITDQNLANTNQKLQKEVYNLRLQLEQTKKELAQQKNLKVSKSFKFEVGLETPENKQMKQKLNQFKSYKEESDINIEAVYDEQFEEQDNSKSKHQKQDSNKLTQIKKEFEQEQQQQAIYKKSQSVSKLKQSKSNKKKKTANKNKDTIDFKPDKKILAEIKQLLTYRMKSQRYPFNDLKNDIELSETSQFTYADLTNMLVNQPFYLKNEYVSAFLIYCYEKDKINPKDGLTSKVLIQKLRKVIGDFTLMSENQQKEMIIRVAEMTTAYPEQLHIAFQNVRNGEQTVSKKDLIQLFRKLELEDKYIDLIISQLSLCSDDLQHLNYVGFFQRFYIGEDQPDDQAIEQLRQQSEQSKVNSSRMKKDKSKSEK